jgi:hypothetical protein
LKTGGGSQGVIREVVCDVERLSDFLRRLALDHVCNSLTTGIKKRFDIQIIRSLHISYLTKKREGWGNYKDDFKQHLLIDLHELLIPVVDVGGFLISGLILLFFNWIVFVMISPFKNLHVNIPFFHIKNHRWEQREREGGM